MKRLALWEAIGVFLLIEAYIWRIRQTVPWFWMVILAIILLSHALRRETPAGLGFRMAGFRRGARACAPYVAATVALLLALGSALHTLRDVSFGWALLSFVAYCAWGLVQQYLLNGYFVNRFAEGTSRAPLLAAACFCLAHLPNWFLMAITLAGGYIAARVYRAWRNLFLLGLAHAILGFTIYLVVPDHITRHLYVGPKWFSLR
jgi:chromate transport protein ChrA